MNCARAIGSSLLVLGLPLAALAQDDVVVEELLGMSLDDLVEVNINVASRTDSTLLDAPSVVSVVTAADIRRMGARDLRDVLRRVPGFELGIRVFGYPEFGLRGVISDNTEKLLILLDGMPVNEHLEGSGSIVFGDFVLDNIERIEIIRGPGSALYGTNAFVGVVSLISKRPEQDADRVSLGVGSFSTREASVRFGRHGDDWRLAGFLHFLDSDGERSRIEQDALQTRPGGPWFNEVNGGVSLAGGPRGYSDYDRRKLTAQLQAGVGEFNLNALLVNAHKGPYIGTLFTVTEGSEAHPYQGQLDLSYRWQLDGGWRIEPRLHWRRYKADNLWNAMPAGYRIPDGEGGFIEYSEGQFDRQGATQQTYGGELKTTWSPNAAHTVVAGASWEAQKLYDIVNRTNVPGFGPDNMVDAAPIIVGEPDRRLGTLYLQDQWQLHPQWALTAGLRTDRYNDAGTSTTPRFAAVWRPHDRLSFKALYGEAFRAPTFVESYLFAFGGFARGNVDNRPETIATRELVAIARLGEAALLQLNLYSNRITDLLRLVPNAAGFLEYTNLSDRTVVEGVEGELKFDLSARLSGFVNYSHESGENENTGERLLGMARWRANAGVNYAFSDRFNLNAAVNAVGDRARADFDARDELAGYQVVDLALTWLPAPQWELQLAAHNLFDEDQRFPDVSAGLSNDFPWEGRALELRLHWTP